MRRRHKTRIAVIVVLLIAVAAALELSFRPRIHISRETELVRIVNTPLSSLLFKGASLDEIKTAVEESGKSVDQISWLGGSLLYHAVLKGRRDVAEWLLSKNANPDGIHYTSVPLGTAVGNEDIEMIKLLIAWGADPDADMGDDMTPRSLAKLAKNPEVMAALSGRAETPSTAPAQGAVK